MPELQWHEKITITKSRVALTAFIKSLDLPAEALRRYR
jgi:hypothetical protein